MVIRVCIFTILSIQFILDGALSGPSQFLATESTLKMMKNAFILSQKIVFKIFKILSWISSHVTKRPNEKDKDNFKFYDVAT